MSDCEHGYVVRAAEGDNRYWCKECDERFPAYPTNESRIAARKAFQEELFKKEVETFKDGAKALAEMLYRKKK